MLKPISTWVNTFRRLGLWPKKRNRQGPPRPRRGRMEERLEDRATIGSLLIFPFPLVLDMPLSGSSDYCGLFAEDLAEPFGDTHGQSQHNQWEPAVVDMVEACETLSDCRATERPDPAVAGTALMDAYADGDLFWEDSTQFEDDLGAASNSWWSDIERLFADDAWAATDDGELEDPGEQAGPGGSGSVDANGAGGGSSTPSTSLPGFSTDSPSGSVGSGSGSLPTSSQANASSGSSGWAPSSGGSGSGSSSAGEDAGSVAGTPDQTGSPLQSSDAEGSAPDQASDRNTSASQPDVNGQSSDSGGKGADSEKGDKENDKENDREKGKGEDKREVSKHGTRMA